MRPAVNPRFQDREGEAPAEPGCRAAQRELRAPITSLAVAATVFGLAGFAISRAVRSRYSFAQKVVLITGGSRGLGLVLARRLADEGARLVLLARDTAELANAESDLESRGTFVLTISCDLLVREEIAAAVRKAMSHFGRVDVLINNAGVIEVGPLAHMQRADFEHCLQLHFWAAYELTQLVVPEMRRRGGGRIVNISSIGGKLAPPHLAPYAVSKFALTGFSDAIRSELAPDGIKVTTVAPGLMRTGSHINAKFKGARDREYAWFAIANGMPGISMHAERAAAKIIAACRRGQPSLTLTYAARLAIAANAVAPNLTGHAMKIANRLLPEAIDESGNEASSGEASRHRLRSWMTGLVDNASARNNELHRPAKPPM